ncbi:MAG TPA: hypothetical protein VMO24_10075, partial [Woeseiaceae bacterium]|nr:hypothetical protein [Woeseiaceae bacterium]
LHKLRRPCCVMNPLMQGADRRSYPDTDKVRNVAAGDSGHNPHMHDSIEQVGTVPCPARLRSSSLMDIQSTTLLEPCLAGQGTVVGDVTCAESP